MALSFKGEAFAVASFMMSVNLMRVLVAKGVMDRGDVLHVIEEARRQLNELIIANKEATREMIRKNLLDYEAIFRDVEEESAEELLRTLGHALNQVLEGDARPD